MDNQSLNASQSPKNKNFARYVLYGSEILVPIFLLGLIFFLLNYLNILRFGTVFPFLSFLPHLPTSQVTNTGPSGKPVITPFQYDARKGYNTLYTYLNDTIPQPLRPLETTPSALKTPVTDTPINWNYSDGTASAHITYVKNKDTMGMVSLFFVPKTPPPADLSTDIATSVLKQYFTNASINTVKCKTEQYNFTFCEQFTQKNGYKEGFGLFASPPNWTSPVYFIFSCRLYPESPTYKTETSCSLTGS